MVKNVLKVDGHPENFYKSVLDQDRAAVVICNLKHEIIYMNSAAVQNYEKWGGLFIMISRIKTDIWWHSGMPEN
jgi:hypothetical protein